MEMQNFEKLFINGRSYNFFNKIYLNWIYKKLKIKRLYGDILEFGCGVGETTKFISHKYGFKKLIAIDYDKSQLMIAKDNVKKKNVTFQKGDASSLRFKDSSFDFVVESDTLHHMKDYKKTPLEKVSWMPKKVTEKMYNLGVSYLEDFYSMARGMPEPTREHLGINPEEYRNLVKRVEHELPEEFVKLHDKPAKRHPGRLITD